MDPAGRYERKGKGRSEVDFFFGGFFLNKGPNEG